MLRYVLGITIITAVLIVIRALTDGKILKRYQYALWLFIPFYMIVSPFLRIGIPIDAFIPEKEEVSITSTKANPEHEVKTAQRQEAAGEKTTIRPSGSGVKETGKALKTVNWRAVFNRSGFAVSVLIMAALTAYNIGFLIYCKRRRKLVGSTYDGKLEIFSLDHKETPFLLFNKIYVGESEGLNEYIICHEECHYRHGDQWWIVLRHLVLALNWYNPVIWAAFVLSGQDCELACDEEVIKVLGEDSSAGYAETLFELIRQRSEVSFGFRLSAMIRGDYNIMKKRLVSIKHPAGKSYKALALCLAAILVFTGCASVQPVSEKLNIGIRPNAVSKKSSSDFPVYKNVARQICDDGWVYTFVYEYEKENVEKIDGLVKFYFYGINVRYRYADDYYETEKDGIPGTAAPYRTGMLIWGRSKETASDSAKIDALLEKSDKESLLALDPKSIEFTSLDKDMFFRLMREALNGKPQAESGDQTYWDYPFTGPLTEKEYKDGYKFQVCILLETGLIDVCYIDVLYKTGSGQSDYVQLSDLVTKGTATDEQVKCFRKLQQIAKLIEEKETLMAGADQSENAKYGDIDMQRLSDLLSNLHNGKFEQYLSE